MEQVHAGLKMQIETNTRRTLDLETERAQLQEEHSKLDNTISGRGRWNDIDQKRTVLGAKLKLLQDKERKLRDKRRDQVRRLVWRCQQRTVACSRARAMQATYSQGIFALARRVEGSPLLPEGKQPRFQTIHSRRNVTEPRGCWAQARRCRHRHWRA